MLSLVFYNKAKLTEAFIETAFAAKLIRGDGHTISQFTEMVLRGDAFLDGNSKAIKAPTLVLEGSEEGLTSLAIGEAYEQEMARAERNILDKSVHMLQIECAAVFNSVLLKFLHAPTSGN